MRAPLFDLPAHRGAGGAVEVFAPRAEGRESRRSTEAPTASATRPEVLGYVPLEDALENTRSPRFGRRLPSSYPAGDAGEEVWIITETDHFPT